MTRKRLAVSSKRLEGRDLTPMVRRILAVWRSASADRVAEGLIWYAEAHDIARELTPADVRVGAGVLAALSPQNAWGSNVKAARQAVRAGTARGTHTHGQADKADAILDGEAPLTVLAGPKERAFYACILAGGDATSTVVVDRHAHDVAVGRVFGSENRGLSHPVRFDNIARAYVRAAEIVSRELGRPITPAHVQATTWLVWRDRHHAEHAANDPALSAKEWPAYATV